MNKEFLMSGVCERLSLEEAAQRVGASSDERSKMDGLRVGDKLVLTTDDESYCIEILRVK